MSNYIELTADEIIDYILENKCSIRQASAHFGISVGSIWNRINEYSGGKKGLIKTQFNTNTKQSYKNLKNYGNKRKV